MSDAKRPEPIPDWELEFLEGEKRITALGARSHGLFYVSRDGESTWVLDRKQTPEIPRPERDVLIALLEYAVDHLRGRS